MSDLALGLDHIVVAADTLARGCDYVADVLGVAPTGGGRHVRMGTHNRVLRMGEQTYLEVIAIDPEGEVPFMPRWFGLDRPEVRHALRQRPRLLTWVARGDDLAAAATRLPVPTAAHAMQRGELHWTFLFTQDGGLMADGLLPNVIQWPAGQAHPATRMPDAGCRLNGLRGFHADAAALNITLGTLGLGKEMVVRKLPPLEAPRVQAMIDTPTRGVVVLD
jgi:hypothetical protein